MAEKRELNPLIDWNSTQFICCMSPIERYIVRKEIILTLTEKYKGKDVDIRALADDAMCNRVCNLNLI